MSTTGFVGPGNMGSFTRAPNVRHSVSMSLVCGALAPGAGGCAGEHARDPTPAGSSGSIRDAEPIESTAADTRLDLIRGDDPSAFARLAETSLYAYPLLHHPDRVPVDECDESG